MLHSRRADLQRRRNRLHGHSRARISTQTAFRSGIMTWPAADGNLSPGMSEDVPDPEGLAVRVGRVGRGARDAIRFQIA